MQGDRVVLGGDYFFRFNYPLEADATLKKGHRDFEYARNEWVKAQTARYSAEGCGQWVWLYYGSIAD